MVKKKTSPRKTSSNRRFSVIEDLKSAALVVSLLLNLGVLTAWITIQVTTRYDQQVLTFLFSR
jgi:hypothetical protein